ncbi:MAG TPA: hypothetical protein VF017_07340 [Thermoanaerobaculia bacterium]|nr:hypothetical protein [Thermoanaerobaculia bacterium]
MNRKLARKAIGVLMLAALLVCPVVPASADPGSPAATGWWDWAARWVEEVWSWWTAAPSGETASPILEKSGTGGFGQGGGGLGGGSNVNSCSGYTSDPDGCPGSS